VIDPDKLRELLAGATPGPWGACIKVEGHPHHWWIDAECNCTAPNGRDEYMSVSGICRDEDAALIAITPDLATAYLAALDRIEALEAREKEAERLLQSWEGVYSNSEITAGVCCCGDDMADHADPMSCGHSPLDMGEYAASHVFADTRAWMAGKAVG
jgi:hypothetical protein